MKKLIVTIGVLIGLGIAGTVIAHLNTAKVSVVAVRVGEISQTVEDIGYVQSIDAQIYHAPVIGRISGLFVTEGDLVKIGQPIVAIDNPEWREQLAALYGRIEQVATQLATEKNNFDLSNVDLSEADRQVQLKDTLRSGGIISHDEYTNAVVTRDKMLNGRRLREKSIHGLEQQMRALQSEKKHMVTRLQELHIRSALSGTVLSLPVKLNQVVTPGTVLAHVGPEKKLEIEVKLLADDIAKVRQGQRVIIDKPDVSGLTGIVKKIYPEAQTIISSMGVEERRVPVIIALATPGALKPGFDINISIITGHKTNAMLIPREAIFRTPNGTYQIRKIANNRIVVQSVKLGHMNVDVVEILEGVREKDLVVLNGNCELKHGCRVRF